MLLAELRRVQRQREEQQTEVWEAEWTEREAQRVADERAARVRSRSA
eukprot:COSAG04_NODE_346_length_16127_cov_10.497442_7_plen_47_part_00